MGELKPCPFCGAEPVKKYIGNAHTKKRAVKISCPQCRIQRTDAAIHHDHEWVDERATINWNQRHKVLEQSE